MTLVASPGTVNAGQSSTLTWTSTGATTLTIDPAVPTPKNQPLPLSGTAAVAPTTTTTYTITAIGPGGTATTKVTVTVNQVPPKLVACGTTNGLFTPTCAVVTFGATQQITSNASVTWSVDGVTGGNSSIGAISASGLYTPPHAVGQHTITAASQEDLSQAASATVWVSNSAPVLTHKYDNYRMGQNVTETVLTPSNVTSDMFGLLLNYEVDGYIYAQPLYVPDLHIVGDTHNVVYVATEHDSVYAFNADGRRTSPLWHVSFIDPPAGITTFSTPGATGVGPEIGITSTPVN